MCSFAIILHFLHTVTVKLTIQGFFPNSSLWVHSYGGGQHCVCIVWARTHSLFTPYHRALRPEHQCYNTAVWQREEWFPVSPNKLCLEPRRFCLVIISTALLHNYLKQHGHPGPHVADDRLVPMVEEANDKEWTGKQRCFCFAALVKSLWNRLICISCLDLLFCILYIETENRWKRWSKNDKPASSYWIIPIRCIDTFTQGCWDKASKVTIVFLYVRTL